MPGNNTSSPEASPPLRRSARLQEKIEQADGPVSKTKDGVPLRRSARIQEMMKKKKDKERSAAVEKRSARRVQPASTRPRRRGRNRQQRGGSSGQEQETNRRRTETPPRFRVSACPAVAHWAEHGFSWGDTLGGSRLETLKARPRESGSPSINELERKVQRATRGMDSRDSEGSGSLGECMELMGQVKQRVRGSEFPSRAEAEWNIGNLMVLKNCIELLKKFVEYKTGES